jgi:zinc transport system substrate-binding protein
MKKLLFFIFAVIPLISHSFEVTVGIAPQKYITERIAGELVKVHVLMDKGADPHSFSPKPAQAASLARSKIFFGIGFPYEKVFSSNLKKTFKELKVVDTSAGLMDSVEDPHLWTSPRMVMRIARVTFSALAEEDPKNRGVYRANYIALVKEITDWDGRFTLLFSGYKNRSFLVYHPFLGYFAKDYELTQYSVEKDGKPPKPQDVAFILDTVKKDNITVFLTVKTHSEEPADFIARQSGLTAVRIDLLNENWDDLMQEIYNAFSR